MLENLLIILPIFGLVAAGYIVRRLGLLGPYAATELNRFVVTLALPALLFEIVANAGLAQIWRPDFIIVFTGGCLITMLIVLVLRLRSQGLADAGIEALAAAYPNTAYMGFPLVAATIGASGETPTLLASIIVVCVLFAIALVLVESGLQKDRRPLRLIGKVTVSVLRNPLVIAPLLGLGVTLWGFDVPAPLARGLDLLGAAAAPCALVTIGIFLASPAKNGRMDFGAVALLSALKLAVLPAVTWLLATFVLRLPAETTHVAVLLAALPTGTGPFMIAELYGRQPATSAGTILVTTILSLFSVSAYLAWVG